MADSNAGTAVAQPVAKGETSADVVADLGAQPGTAGYLQYAVRGRVAADDQQRVAGIVRLQDQVEDAIAIQVADEALVGRRRPGHGVQIRRRWIVEGAVAGTIAQQDDILQRWQERNRRSHFASHHDHRSDRLQVEVRLTVAIVVAAIDTEVCRTPASGGRVPDHETDRHGDDPRTPTPHHASPRAHPHGRHADRAQSTAPRQAVRYASLQLGRRVPQGHQLATYLWLGSKPMTFCSEATRALIEFSQRAGTPPCPPPQR